MFPGASLADVESRIAAYSRLLGRFQTVRAKLRHPNVFEIATG